MSAILAEMLHTLKLLLLSPLNNGLMLFALKFIPYVIFLEMPVYLFINLGILRYYLRQAAAAPTAPIYCPKVSCLVTCSSEGKAVGLTIRSLVEQTYAGVIEILPIVDGAVQNAEIYKAALA